VEHLEILHDASQSRGATSDSSCSVSLSGLPSPPPARMTNLLQDGAPSVDSHVHTQVSGCIATPNRTRQNPPKQISGTTDNIDICTLRVGWCRGCLLLAAGERRADFLEKSPVWITATVLECTTAYPGKTMPTTQGKLPSFLHPNHMQSADNVVCVPFYYYYYYYYYYYVLSLREKKKKRKKTFDALFVHPSYTSSSSSSVCFLFDPFRLLCWPNRIETDTTTELTLN